MTTYYVATDGSSGNNGLSALTPKQTYAQANALATTGDTVLGRGSDVFRELVTAVAGVTYGGYGGAPILDGTDLMTGFADGGSNIWDKGSVTTQPNLVWINGTLGSLKGSRVACAAPGDWYWTANTLSVYATGDPSGLVEAGQRDRCINITSVANVTVRDTVCQRDNKTSSNSCITISGSTGATLYGVAIRNVAAGGVNALSSSTGCVIRFCIMDHVGLGNVSNSGSHVFLSSNNCTIEYCAFTYSGNYAGDHALYINGACSGTIYRNNLSDNVVGYHVVNNSGTTCAVYRNVFLKTVLTGTADGALSVTTGSSTTFYHNTVIGLYRGVQTLTSFIDLTCRNNIFAALTNRIYDVQVLGSGTTSTNYNCVFPYNVSQWNGDFPSTWGNWQALPQDASSLNQDPLLVSGGSVPGDIQSGSPCINAGVSLAGINDGPDQVYGAAPDIGAIEYWPLTRIRRIRSRPRPWRPWR